MSSMNIPFSCSNAGSDILQPHLNLANDIQAESLESFRELSSLPSKNIRDPKEDSDNGAKTPCRLEESTSSDLDGVILLNYQHICDREKVISASQKEPQIESPFTKDVARTLNKRTLPPPQFNKYLQYLDDRPYSDPEPHLLAKARTYDLPNRPDPSLVRSQQTTTSITSITEAVRNIALGTNPHQEVSPRISFSALRHFTLDPHFLAECEEREKTNPFPGVDMNLGWNRARCKLLIHFQDALGTVEERKRIAEGFQGYSLWAQREPIVMDEDKVKMFDKVFVGRGHGKSAWLRTPGRWWAARRGLFERDQGACFLERLQESVWGIMEKVDEWREKRSGIQCGVGGVKRKWSQFTDGDKQIVNQVSKKLKKSRTKSVQVMSEEWRTRRRTQERKAGRWTDGTLRMDPLWATFHWVWDVEDVTDPRWGVGFGDLS